MKKIFVMMSCLLAATAGLYGQRLRELGLQQTLPTYRLELSPHKTRLLIFPAPIKEADRGDEYVMAEVFGEAGNILKVKAADLDFAPSNLQVVTTDGKVYSFCVRYAEAAPDFPVDMGRQAPYAPAYFKGVSLNSKQLEELAGRIAGHHAFLHGGKYRKHGMVFGPEGIYIREGVLFFCYRLRNKTHIPYEAASLRFFIRDKKKARRTASQDRELQPLSVFRYGSPGHPKGQTIVAAFSCFTIAERKWLQAEMMEQDGDRNPACRLDQDKLLRARPL